MKKLFLHLAIDEDTEDFLTTADLGDYGLLDGNIMQLEFEQSNETVNLRLPTTLVEAVRKRAIL